ncbi:MAG: polyprenyl synthetase family protein [Candidatus Omnitrophica bacterium]|nr:polyprenyl synthetase family protein [Candidatus Omnitrophota bacterium]
MKAAATLEEIYAPVESRLQAIPETILEILSTPNELAADVIRYFFSGKGKLLRPALTLLGAELKSTDEGLEPRLLKLASSYEIFHGATLIHDDIIDSAYLRRNIPTINVKWGPEVAVLVGDYLHDKAIAAIFENGNPSIVSTFLKTAGEVCDGEIHELKEKDNFVLSEAEYLAIIEKKTASLLACALESGAILGGANSAEIHALRRFGRDFGIAFQIVDDCLDFTGNEHEFGKTLGADCFAGVLTLPLIRLFEILEPAKKGELMQLFKSETPGKFQTLLDKVRDSGAIDYAMEKAKKYSAAARNDLDVFSDSPAKRSFERLVDYVLERNR